MRWPCRWSEPALPVPRYWRRQRRAASINHLVDHLAGRSVGRLVSWLSFRRAVRLAVRLWHWWWWSDVSHGNDSSREPLGPFESIVL